LCCPSNTRLAPDLGKAAVVTCVNWEVEPLTEEILEYTEKVAGVG